MSCLEGGRGSSLLISRGGKTIPSGGLAGSSEGSAGGGAVFGGAVVAMMQISVSLSFATVLSSLLCLCLSPFPP